MKHLAGVCPTCKHHARWTKDREWEKSSRYRCDATVTMFNLHDNCYCTDPFHARVSGWQNPNKGDRKQK
jgi:hypothetical protein